MTVHMLSARRTHGGARSENEDTADWRLEDGMGCWAVADGLGGHGGGQLASRAAVSAVLETFSASPEASRPLLDRLVTDANDAVRRAQQGSSHPGMRTTITLLVSDSRLAAWTHVGDTRLYHLRNGRVVHQTADHSVPQGLVDAGQITPHEIRSHPERNRILRALGHSTPPEGSIAGPTPIEVGDAFLLCSDGWWEYVTEPEMEADYAKSATPDEWLDHMMQRVLQRATGEFDNLTAIGVFVADGTGYGDLRSEI